jgi:nitronate monooxygenase
MRDPSAAHPSVDRGLDALDPETAPVRYGQSARFVRAIRPAAEVVATASEEAERILRTRPAALLD